MDNCTYVAIIPGGFLKKHYSVVVLELKNDVLRTAIFSKEGLIKQNTSQGVLDELEKRLGEYLR